MIKLIRSSNRGHLFGKGTRLQIRSGNSISKLVEIVPAVSDQNTILITVLSGDGGNRLVTHTWSSSKISNNALRELLHRHVSGLAIYEVVESCFDKPEGGRWAMVHKPFLHFKDGMRIKATPRHNAMNQNTYELNIASTKTQPGLFRVTVSMLGASYGMDHHVQKPSDIAWLDNHTFHLFIEDEVKAVKEEVKLCPNGAKAIPEVDDRDENGQYIIWCPSSNLPPRKINRGAAQAKAIAASMSERHGKTFYWCRLMGKVDQKVIKTTETLITEM